MRRGGLWLANPPARSSSLAAADGVFAVVQDERGRTVGVRDARAPASAPLLRRDLGGDAMSRPGGLWRANPARRSFDSLGGFVVEDVDGDGVSDAARDPNATAGASPVYTRYQRTDPAPASPIAAMFAGGGGALKPALFVGGVLLVAVVVRKLREAKRRG